MPGVRAGLFLENEGLSWGALRELAGEAEDAGLDSLWVQDHFYFTHRPLLEAFTLLGGLARTTDRIRLGTMVACNSYRNPALLAKMAATLDRLSDGRLTLGLGAGWHQEEYEAYGYPFPRAGVRVGRLEEALQVVGALWTRERTTFHGRYYDLEGALCDPKPLQAPRPPLWVGGGGPRILRIAARWADGVNLLSPPGVPHDPEETAERVDYVRGHREDGTPFTVSILGLAVVDEDRAAVRRGVRTLLAKYAPRARLDRALRTALRRPRLLLSYLGFLLGGGYPSFLFAGSPEEVAAQMAPYVDAGVDVFVLDLHSSGLAPGSFRLLTEEVLPSL